MKGRPLQGSPRQVPQQGLQKEAYDQMWRTVMFMILTCVDLS
jgi:hypothetical protein